MKSTIPASIPYGCATATMWLRKWGSPIGFPRAACVLRAGYGLQYGPILPSTYAWIRGNPPANNMLSLQQPNLIQALTLASGTSLAGATQGLPFLTVWNRTWSTRIRSQYNLSWERELRGSWHVQLGSVGSQTYKMIMLRSINRELIGPGINVTEDNVDARRPNQNYSSIR